MILPFPPATLNRARRLLCALEDHIRATLIAARTKSAASFARVAAVTAADTIYQVDKISEEAIFHWFEAHWPKAWPVQIVMEGIEDADEVTFPPGTPASKTVWKCILDPIDGTRNVMYDKRSAWILAGLAPQRGAKNHLGDIVVAAMTEIPTTKMWRSDQLSAVRGGRLVATATDVYSRSRDSDTRSDGARKASASNARTASPARTSRLAQSTPAASTVFPASPAAALPPSTRLSLRPSQAGDFKHGFASLVKFFPDGKALTAGLEEALWRELEPTAAGGSPLVFDDQYITTGGQVYELIVGHDRMIGDLRPLVFAKLGLSSSLVCHPYDICIALLLEAAGGVIERPEGGALRAPLDTTSPVSWVGYANPKLARKVRPVLARLLREHGLT